MTKILLDDAALDKVRRANRILARVPRLRVPNRLLRALVQAALLALQAGADGRLARRGIRVGAALAESGGLRVPLRVLRPAGKARGVVLDIHGGGWVAGNPRVDDAHNAALIESCGVAVVSVDYRLLPRATMQEAMDDCLAAARWLLAGGIPDLAALPAFILGESAGAHLAATVLLRLGDAPGPCAGFDGAVLYYGVYDLGGTPSARAAGPGTLVLDGPGIVEALRTLTPGCSDSERCSAPLSPLHGRFAGLPPALLFGGERDPLRDDTTALARRWAQVAEVELHILPEAPHGFLRFPTPLADIAPQRTHAWLRERIARHEAAGAAAR